MLDLYQRICRQVSSKHDETTAAQNTARLVREEVVGAQRLARVRR